VISPGPYKHATIPEGPDQVKCVIDYLKFGKGPIHAVYLPNHPATVVGKDADQPEHVVILCITGNGYNSENNAKALVALLESNRKVNEELDWLRTENKRLDETIRGIEELEEKADALSWKQQCEDARATQVKATKAYLELLATCKAKGFLNEKGDVRDVIGRLAYTGDGAIVGFGTYSLYWLRGHHQEVVGPVSSQLSIGAFSGPERWHVPAHCYTSKEAAEAARTKPHENIELES